MRFKTSAAAFIAAVTVVSAGSSAALADAPKTNTNTTKVQTTTNNVTVKPGDYLAEIASGNNTTYQRIYDANEQIQDPNLIYPGEVLRIPSADEQLTDRSLPAQTTPAPATQSTGPADTPSIAGGSVWDSLASCESGGDWSIDTGNGFYGGLQFTLGSWQAVGGSGYPNQASRDEQINRAEILQSRQGWSAWPACSAKLGL